MPPCCYDYIFQAKDLTINSNLQKCIMLTIGSDIRLLSRLQFGSKMSHLRHGSFRKGVYFVITKSSIFELIDGFYFQC